MGAQFQARVRIGTGLRGDTKLLAQGEIEATVRLRGKILEVEKHYLVYPNSSIIRQWVKFKNRTSAAITVANPYMLDDRLLESAASTQTLSYMTGGGYI